MTLTNKIKSNRGFSLVEFLIAVGILAVLAIIAIPITVGIINSSNKQNDEVLAATYSEYMQKFSTEQAGDAEFYTTLSDNGAEYDLLKSTSGQGSFPGLTQLTERINNATSEDMVWDQIRKEACIAIKAYGKVELADNINYFVEPPVDEDMAFVYYYLTGTVALKPVDEMEQSKISIDDVNDGTIDTEDYWVYLDRRGGSGKAIGTSDPNANRDFHVLVLQFGTDTPVSGAEITISPEAPSVGADRKVTTSSTGRIVFRDSYFQLLISATHKAAAPFWNVEYYPDDNPHVNLAQNPEIGTLENPYIIRLKMGTRGSLELYEKQKTYTYVSGSTINFEEKDILLTWDNAFETNFAKKDTSVTGRNEDYYHSTPGSNPLKLMGLDESGISRFLLYGDYGMSIKNTTTNPATGNSNFLTYTENITSDIWGIYNTENPGEYKDKTTEYAYPVVLTRTDTLIKGQIVSEKKEQPLHGTYAVITGSKAAGSGTGGVLVQEEKNLNSYVCVVSKKDRSIVYYSNVLTPSGQTSDGSYIYDFEIHMKNENNGQDEFEVYLVTEYGNESASIISGQTTDALTVSVWPSTIVNDGSTYIFKTQTNGFAKVDLQNDVKNGTVKIKVFERFTDTSTKNISYKVNLYRHGYSKNTSFPNKEATVSGKLNNGEITLTDVKQGFYTMVITLDDVYNGDYSNINGQSLTVFIDDNNEFIFEFKPVLLSYSIICYPTDKDWNYLTNDINMLDSNSTYGYSKLQITKIEIDGQPVSATVNIDAVSPTNNGALITFSYGKTCESLLIEQSVTCFNPSDKFYKDAKIGKNASSYSDSFKIRRLENLAKSETEHPVACLEWFSESENYHYRECQRCLYLHMRTAHDKRQKLDGSIVDVSPTYYASAAYTSNNASVGTSHYKHCNVCNKFDKQQNCTSLTDWTWTYNLYTKSSNHTGHTGANGVLLTKNSNASNSTNRDSGYHYKYCTQCNQRVKSQLHKDVIQTTNIVGQCAPNAADAVASYFLEECICEYRNEIKGSVPEHDKYSVYYYLRDDEDYCLEKNYSTKCYNCALNLSGQGCYYYSAAEATSITGKKDTSYGWSEPWRRRFLSPTAHLSDSRHTTYCEAHASEFGNTLPCEFCVGWYYVSLTDAELKSYTHAVGKFSTLWSYRTSAGGGSGYCKAYSNDDNVSSAKYEFRRKDGLEWMAVWRIFGLNTTGNKWRVTADTGNIAPQSRICGGVLFETNSSGRALNYAYTFDNVEFTDPLGLETVKAEHCSSYGTHIYTINCCCRPFTWPASNYPSYSLASPAKSWELRTYACFNTWNAHSRNPYATV